MSYTEIPEISGNVYTIDFSEKNIINEKYFFSNSENDSSYNLVLNFDDNYKNKQFTTVFLFKEYGKINIIKVKNKNIPFHLKEEPIKEEPTKTSSSIQYTKQTMDISIDNNNNINILSVIKKYYLETQTQT